MEKAGGGGGGGEVGGWECFKILWYRQNIKSYSIVFKILIVYSVSLNGKI